MEETKRKVSRIEVDKNVCIGCGTCVVIAPKAFDISEEGYSVVKDSWREVDDEKLIEAAKSCPSGVVTLFDSEGNKINL